MITIHKLTFNSIIAILLVYLVACDKVIDLNLKDASGKYVIEGNITNQAGPYFVRITKSVAFYNDNSYPGVPGAKVTIKDNNGFQEALLDMGNGTYSTKKLIGKSGNTYYLNITIDTFNFSAESTMPMEVKFDSLYISDETIIGKLQKAAVVVFKDPIGQGNNYLFNQYINGSLDKTIYNYNDNFSDGQLIKNPLLRSDPDSTLHIGDKVVIEMQCIDKYVYNYWYSVDNAASGDGSGIPSNPVSNIQGNALGYFSAHTSSKKEIKVIK